MPARRGVRVGAEVRDVGDALLLVHYKILDDVQILSAALEREMLGRVAVRPAIVHVHVQIPAPPALCRQIRHAIEDDAPHRRAASPYRRLGPPDAEFGPVPHRDVRRPRGHRQLGRAGRVEVAVLEAALASVEGFIGMTPGIVRGIRPPVGPRDRDARRERTPGVIDHLQAQPPNRPVVAAPGGEDPLPLSPRHIDHPERGVATFVRDVRDPPAVSNEGGNTSLWVIDVPGGQRQRILATRRRYHGPVGRLRLEVVDHAGRPLPARISVTRPDGRAYAPDDAWRHADEAFDRGEGSFEYGYFHTSGPAELTVPAGPAHVAVWHGPEFRVGRAEATVRAGGTTVRRIVLDRVADLPAQGWWSGDLHVHMNYGGAYRNTPEHLAFQGRAEDLHVVENLVVNKEQRIPDIAYFRTDPDPASSRHFLLLHSQEFHTSYWGHTALLGLTDHYLLPEYAGYPITAAASLFPANADVADLAHAQGALFGYVHPFDTQPDPTDTTEGLTYELPVDAALGKVDYMEVMGYSDHLVTSGIWYRLLNCGFRIPAGAGTDAFPNFASLRGPPGLVRVFVRAGRRLDRATWTTGLKAGRTFVTNAPLLEFTLGGREIGDEIRLPAGGRLTARVGLRSSVPIDHLEVIGNGSVVATIPRRRDRTATSDTVSFRVARSGWYVLRAWSDRPALPILDLYPFGSTSPIYVRVGREPVRSREDAEFFARWIDRLDV